MKKSKRMKLADQLRRAIAECGRSRHKLSKETGLTEAVLSRFMHRKGFLSEHGLNQLGEALGLSLTIDEGK
jgi:hypothetical protein